jgi:integrase
MASIRKHRGKWQVQIRRRGVPSLSKCFITKKDAETWARQTEIQADRSELPKNPRQLERVTLRDLVIRYRDEVTPQKQGRDVEVIVFNAFLKHPICSKRLSDLSAADFAVYRDERLRKVRATTLKREFSPLHNLFEIATREWGLPLRENPLDSVKLICSSNRRERRLQEGELERITDAAGKTKNKLILPIILFALETGLRRSEILAATWTHLHLANRVLVVPRAKNGHSRSIPLTRSAISILEGLNTSKVGEGRVFPTTANALRLSWERLLQRADVNDLHFHDLRHEAISRFFELGLTAPEVSLISGHRDMRMLFRYSHPLRQRILHQMDKDNATKTAPFKQA